MVKHIFFIKTAAVFSALLILWSNAAISQMPPGSKQPKLPSKVQVPIEQSPPKELNKGVKANASQHPCPSPPKNWCTDSTGFLSASAKGEIDAILRDFEQKTGNQVIVYISDTTGDIPLEEWCTRTFNEWDIGQKGLDNGLALFVFTRDQRLRIEVGYGLQDRVSNAVAADVIKNKIVPKIQSGQKDQAIRDGVKAILSIIGSAPTGTTKTGTKQKSIGPLSPKK